MQTIVTSLLLATTVGGLGQPLPIDWTRTPTGPTNAVLYTTERAGNALWSVGIDLEPGEQGTLKFHPLALRWDGKTWRQTSQPMPDGRLDDVLVKSATDVWAVGATDGIDLQPVLQRWKGSAWELVAVPEQAGQFTTIAAQGNGLLIGKYADQASVVRYADGRWRELPREGLEHIAFLDDLVAVGSKEIWAAGIGGVARYDGTRWSKVELPVEVPEGRSFEVAKLVVNSSHDIWAVGMKNHAELWRQPLALHFDGKTWTEFATPEITGQFHDLEFVDGKAVAVGGNPDTGQPLVAELAGKEFVETTTPPGAGYLHGSTRIGRCLWTVGVAAERVNGFETPFAAIGKHAPGGKGC